MPLTFPSHAAAVLPLLGPRQRWLPPTALMVGTCSPDLSYLLGALGTFAHRPAGVLLFCLPAGLLLYAALEGVVLPVLATMRLSAGGFELERFFCTRGLPRTRRGWAAAAGAVALGAVTHLAWDGLTHARRWPASALFAHVEVDLLGQALSLPQVLQHVSTLVGGLVVLAYAARRHRHLLPSRAVRAPRLEVLGPPLAGALAGLGWGFYRPLDSEHFRSSAFSAFWSGVAFGLASLTLACAADLVLRRMRRREPRS